MFKFLHAADIHLDSPLRGLEAYEDAPVEEIRRASRRAFDNLVELALVEEVEFLLISGDLFDGEWRDARTGLYFANRVGRLAGAGVMVFIVSGNHDAASRITRVMDLSQDAVKVFSSRRAESVTIDHLRVAVHGRSYPAAEVTENLSASYPPPVPGHLNVGLLHTALSGREGHANYAPCTAEELRNKGYDYWALGHVHRREVVSEEPWIVFPGNLQGRHARETGPKGATLVTVRDGQVTDVEERELDVLRWSVCPVDLTGCDGREQALDRVRAAILSLVREGAGGRPLALRLRLEGPEAVHRAMCASVQQWDADLRELAAGLGEVWLEKIVRRTTHRAGIDAVSGRVSLGAGASDGSLEGAAGEIEAVLGDSDGDGRGEGPLAALLRAIHGLELDSSESLVELVPELASVRTRVPHELLDESTLAGALTEHDQIRSASADLREAVKALLLGRLAACTQRRAADERGKK